jgi:predicted O-methyltransferase YrrM
MWDDTDDPAWAVVDDYLQDRLVTEDPALVETSRAIVDAGLPPIGVTPLQGKLLMLLARLSGASRILEIGTLGGYSTTWLARALPQDGHLITLEAEPRHAEVARANLDRSGVGDRVDIRLAPALDTLPRLAEEGAGPFDLVFIDADKPNTPHYVRWALELTRPGSVIITDNVVRHGGVADATSDDEAVRGMRAFLDLAAGEPRLDATAVQTVGAKGWDGFVLAIVR